MKSIDKQRKASLVVLSLALVVAVYLNWQYSRGTNDYILTDFEAQQTNADFEMDESDMLMSSNDYEGKNYGEAQLVSTQQTDSEKYFEQ